MSDRWEAIGRAAVRWRRAAVAACLALAALVCLSVATGAATAAGATSSGPGTGPSVGSSLSPASSEAVRRAAAAAGRRARRRLNRLRSARTATGSSLGAVPGTAPANAARPANSPTTSAIPTATVYSGPIRPSQLGSGALGNTRTTAKRTAAKSGTSTVAIVIGALGALLVLACAAWALARRRAYEPHWWLSLQHSLGEAGYRTSSTWAEFSDWARRGG